MMLRSSASLAGCALLAPLLLHAAPPQTPPSQAAVQAIRAATQGRLQSTHGQYREPACDGQMLDYDAEAVDLDGDGQLEVFTLVHGSCMGGMAGAHMNLYIRDAGGRWQPQFGFPGYYKVLKTRRQGFPDIQIDGPGQCSPVWRWNGRAYDLHRKCR